MADLVVIDGNSYTRRSPFGVWILMILTLGIYGLIWYYKINDEARRYLNDASISPGIALIAVTFGGVLVLPPYISIYRTGARIDRMEAKAGVSSSISPGLGLLASFVLALHVPYMQEHLNRVWNQGRPTG